MASNPIVRYVADALRFYMEFHARYDGFYGAFIHDPLAVAAALDRDLVTTEALYVDVETRGELTAGMTVADRRRLTGPAAEPRRGGHRGRRRRSSTGSSNASEGWRPTTRTWHARRRGRPASVAVRDEEDGMNLDWLQICAEGQTTPLRRADPGRLSRRAASSAPSCSPSSAADRATSRRPSSA